MGLEGMVRLGLIVALAVFAGACASGRGSAGTAPYAGEGSPSMQAIEESKEWVEEDSDR